MEKIKIGIIGFGNVGKSVSKILSHNHDMELVSVFTRRLPEDISSSDEIPIHHIDNLKFFLDEIDVMILCNGSATDLPKQGPEIAKMFNVIDSYDTHSNIPEYFENMNSAALSSNKVAIISTGWDPGVFSINRLYNEALLPDSKTYTFWGPGVSQGHSQAIRSINGVKDGIQYTIPVDKTLDSIRAGQTNDFSIEKNTQEFVM